MTLLVHNNQIVTSKLNQLSCDITNCGINSSSNINFFIVVYFLPNIFSTPAIPKQPNVIKVNES